MLFNRKQALITSRALKNLQTNKQPFQAPNTCEELYKNTALDMLSNSIIQQLSSTDKIHLILGEDHIGKTTFCRRLLCDAPPETKITFFAAGKQSSISRILLTIQKAQNKLKAPDAQELATQAAKHIFRDLRNQQKPVLLIDDAHLLNPAVIRMIFRFIESINKQGLGTLKLVLIATKQLENKLKELNDAAPADERIQTSLLRPLARIEIADYIEFRLSIAGVNNKPLGVKTLNQIYELSSGLPGKIDLLVCEIFNHGRIITGNKLYQLQKRMLPALAASVPLIAAAYWFSRSEPEPIVPANQTPPSPTRQQEQAEPPIVRDQPALPIKPPEEDTNNPEEEEQAPSPTSQEAGASTLRDTEWLQQWPQDYYIIQLLGLKNREKLIDVGTAYQLEHELILHQSERNGEPWHTLLYGTFANEQEAKAALGQLPADLKAHRPWLRQIGTILSY